MKKVLVGSPIRQKSKILKEFLISLQELNQEGIQMDYFFIDDNVDEESSKLLNDLQNQVKGKVILKTAKDYMLKTSTVYDCNNVGHVWKRDLIEKITAFKDDIIDYARENDYDYLFFIDSDLILHKETINHLVARNVDIVSNVFWTQWYPNEQLKPQVWVQDFSSYYKENWDKALTQIEKKQEEIDFVTKLRFPGIYEVGGLGACTLISRHAIQKGVKFQIIDNISFWGEDRHFCVRAQALGLKLYVDTVYPAYHIYREQYLDRVEEFKRDGFKFDMCQTSGSSVQGTNKIQKLKSIVRKVKQFLFLRKQAKFNAKRVTDNSKIVFSMIVHNEADKYLSKVLESVKTFADDVLIIDDASTDNTAEVCENILKDFPHTIIKNKKSMFKTEYKLRMKQWKETLKLNPGWIMTLDADEIPEASFKDTIKELIKIDNIDVYNFRLFDMWNDKEYREDKYWSLHQRYMTRLIRYQPKFKYKFKKTNQHCGTFPKNINELVNANMDVRIKHYGWATPEIREAKYKRYMELDPEGKCGIMEQYRSILDKNPNLKVFDERRK